MNEITLRRGGREITLKKVPDEFAVRLKHGTATDAKALKACCTITETEVEHIDALAADGLEVFKVKDPLKLDRIVDTLRASPEIDFVSNTYSISDSPGSRVIPTGMLTIQFKPGIAREEQKKILDEFGLQVQKELDYLPNGYSVKPAIEPKEDPLKIAERLQQRKEIEVAEPDLSLKISYE